MRSGLTPDQIPPNVLERSYVANQGAGCINPISIPTLAIEQRGGDTVLDKSGLNTLPAALQSVLGDLFLVSLHRGMMS